MESRSCTRKTLATGEFGMVERCGCGSIHLTIGAVTLRLAPDVLPVLAGLLADADHSLSIERRSIAPRHDVVLS